MAAVPWIGSRSPTASLNASATNYGIVGNALQSTSTTESEGQTTQRSAGVLSRFYVRVTFNDRGASTFTSRINGADGAQVLSVGSSATGEFSDIVNTDAVAAGDELSFKVVTGAGGTAFRFPLTAFYFAGTSGTVMRYVSVLGTALTLNGVTRFYPLIGAQGGDSTVNQSEAQCQHSSRIAGTLKNAFVNVRTNTKGGTSTFRSRINGGNGAINIPVGAGVTGFLEDTSNTDAVASGDEVCSSVDFFADGNTLRFWSMAFEFDSQTRQGVNLAGSGVVAAITVALSTTTFIAPGSNIASTTETDMRTEQLLGATLSNPTVFVISNGLTGDTTIRVRKNGADGNGLMTIGTGATGWFEDASNRDVFAVGDEFCWQVITPGTGTSIVFNNLAVAQAIPPNYHHYRTMWAA